MPTLGQLNLNSSGSDVNAERVSRPFEQKEEEDKQQIITFNEKKKIESFRKKTDTKIVIFFFQREMKKIGESVIVTVSWVVLKKSFWVAQDS